MGSFEGVKPELFSTIANIANRKPANDVSQLGGETRSNDLDKLFIHERFNPNPTIAHVTSRSARPARLETMGT
jgi:hypothetical protein